MLSVSIGNAAACAAMSQPFTTLHRVYILDILQGPAVDPVQYSTRLAESEELGLAHQTVGLAGRQQRCHQQAAI